MNIIINSPYSKNRLFSSGDPISIDKNLIDNFNNLYSTLRVNNKKETNIYNNYSCYIFLLWFI